MPIHQEVIVRFTTDETLSDCRHQISDDNQVAHSDTKALNRDSGIEDDGSVGIGDLRQSKERRRPPLQVLSTTRLQI